MKETNVKIKNNKAITLISLIITIVVLLILSVVAINSITNDGIIGHANNSKNLYNKEVLKEKIELYIINLNLELKMNSKIFQDGSNELNDIPVEWNGNTPNMGWVYVKNNTIIKYGIYYDDIYIVSTNKGNIIVQDFNYAELINVEDFGANGHDQTDDTAAIELAIEYLNSNGGTLYFPPGTYNVKALNNYDIIMYLKSDKEINIDFFGSTIVLEDNYYTQYYLIYIENCTSAKVRNGFLIGDRIGHDYTTLSGTHELGYGIFFNQTLQGEAFNMDISNMTGDAIINKNGKSGGTVEVSYCDLHHCRRQGISVLDSDVVKISNTDIHHIGTFDNVNGTAPQSGIDLEPASGTFKINSVIIDNVKIYDTTAFGIVKAEVVLADNINISNSYIENIGMQSQEEHNRANFKNTTIAYKNKLVALSNLNFDNCNIELNGNGRLYIKRCNLSNSNINGNGESNQYGLSFIENNIVSNTTFNSHAVNIAGYSSLLEGSENNNYDNCTIDIAGENYNINSCIQNSYISIPSGTTTLNKIEIKNCEVTANSNAEIYIYDCKIINSGTFRHAKKYIYNSFFEIYDLIAFADFPDGSICDNSTIQVKNDLWKNGLNLVKFSNGSKIILDKYNNVNKIPNSYSVLDEDYFVEYNGDIAL